MLLPKSTIKSLQVIQGELSMYSIDIEDSQIAISRKNKASSRRSENQDVIMFDSREFSRYVTRDDISGIAKVMLNQWKKTGVDSFLNLLMGARECVALHLEDRNGIRKKT